jgi:hypothetical protein
MRDQLLPQEKVLAIQEAMAGLLMSKSSNQTVNFTMMDTFVIEVVNIA